MNRSDKFESAAGSIDAKNRLYEGGRQNTDSPLVSIIILVHNQLDYTRRCIDSILKWTPERYELIIVDNGSDEETRTYLCEEVPDVVPEGCLKIIRMEENLGFAKGNNQGLAVAVAPYLVLLNNDVVVTPGWLTGLIDCAERMPQAGIIGPMTNRASGPQVLNAVDYDTDHLKGLNGFARQRALEFKGQTKPFWRIVGFCMLIKRAVVKRIGGFDERYGLGNFEDDDYCIRSAIAGFESWYALDVFVHHFSGRTFSGTQIDVKKSLLSTWSIFKEKWGIPEDLEYGPIYEYKSIVLQSFRPEYHKVELPVLSTSRFMVHRTRARIDPPGSAPPIRTNHPGGPEEAIEILLKHLTENPEDALILNNLGALHSKLGHFRAALDCYRRAFELSPNNLTITKNFADLLYVEYGDVQTAMALYVRVLEADPDDVDCLLACGHISAAQGHETDAIAFYERVSQISPGHPQAKEAYQNVLGSSSMGGANPVQTVEEKYESLLGVDPGSETIPEMEGFARDHQDFALVFNDLGTLYSRTGRAAEAVSHYQRAVQLEPVNTTFIKNLADRLFVIDGNLTDATRLYTRVLELDDHDSEALFALSQICSSLGDDEGQAVFLGRLQQLDSGFEYA